MAEARTWDWIGGSVILRDDGAIRVFVSDVTSVIPPEQVRDIARAILGDRLPGYSPAYELGYHVAWREIQDDVASFAEPKERGIYLGDRDCRVEWARGYDACVCAYRLGHDVAAMIEREILEPTPFTTACVLTLFLDGRLPLNTRPDPRKLTPPPDPG